MECAESESAAEQWTIHSTTKRQDETRQQNEYYNIYFATDSYFCACVICEGFLGPTRFLENQRRLESGDWRPMQPSSAQRKASKFAPPQECQSHRCEAWPLDAQQWGARWLDQHRAGSPTAERRGGSTSAVLAVHRASHTRPNSTG